jgi:hypothetical protein
VMVWPGAIRPMQHPAMDLLCTPGPGSANCPTPLVQQVPSCWTRAG